jgi:uncharacterized protein (TIGR02147 family)
MTNTMVEFLKNKYSENKRANSAYSVRTFAKRAGLSPGAMSEILSGKRAISQKLAEKIALNLKLNPTERSQFFSGSLSKGDRGIKRVRFLSQAQFQYITDPSYFNFLALMDTSIFRNDPQWISQKLEISAEKVNLIVIRFKELNILVENNGVLSKTRDTFSTSDDIKDDFINRAHLETLKAASRSLAEDLISVRDFTSFCFPADPKMLPAVKLKIRTFQDEVAALMLGQKSTEVYKLAINLFPQTKMVDEKDELYVKKV